MTEQPRYAGAVLVDDTARVALQLRDDDPRIENPGMVTTFGGAVETAETDVDAARRELCEEVELEVAGDALGALLTATSVRSDGVAVVCTLYVVRVHDVDALRVQEGRGALVGTLAEVAADPRLTRTCRAAVEALSARGTDAFTRQRHAVLLEHGPGPGS